MCETELEVREKRGSKGKHGTNEMLESDNPPPEYKSDYMVIDLGDTEVNKEVYVVSVLLFTSFYHVFIRFILLYIFFRWVVLATGMWDPL